MRPDLMRHLTEHPWAIHAEALQGILTAARTGEPFNAGEIQARTDRLQTEMQAATPRGGRAQAPGAIAVLPLYGVIHYRASLFDILFGGSNLQSFSAVLRAAITEETVTSVIIDIDSPGGSAFGVEEAANEIRALRGRKPIIAIANHSAASAAYWIASAADEVIISPSGMAGSIGVWDAHIDETRFWDRIGIKWTLIHAGEFKVEGNPFGPLEDDARARMQEVVDQYYTKFVRGVATGRRTSQANVRTQYGQGRMLTAEEALKVGMVDRIESFQDVLTRLGGTPTMIRPARQAAHAENPEGQLARARLELAKRELDARAFTLDPQDAEPPLDSR